MAHLRTLATNPHERSGLIGATLPNLALLLACFWVLSLSGCSDAPPLPEVRDLNVALFVLDTTRADAVEGYGADDVHTPTFARLAREGVRFQNARSTSAWTLPSHGSIFTSLYPSQHGAHAEGAGLVKDRTTLSQLLGRTHEAAGFSENPHIVEARGFARGFDHFEETWREQETHEVPPPTEERIAHWLEGRDRSKPFFLFVNLMTPHLPYVPSPQHQARFVPNLDDRIIDNFRGVEESHARMQIMGKLAFRRLDFSILRALYRADVSYADERLGNILSLLGGKPVLDKTLVIVVSDHGENIGHHGLMEHQFCLYESLLHVPLVMRLPGTLEAGSVRYDAVQLVDILPTILDALDWPREAWPAVEGRSLLEEPVDRWRPSYAEIMRPIRQEPLFKAIDPDFDFAPFLRRLKSVQVGTLKLIASERGARELYDLASDPGERTNLASRRPEDVARLERLLLDWAGGWEPEQGDTAEVDGETREALRALGYLE
ncbi:MAG: sulfatase-like hydrolase/transferase [bacterium]|nr:sulfatase-like hydrolase/transferase [bacterium]